MMRDAWRRVYPRLKDPVYEVDQELQYRNCMESSPSSPGNTGFLGLPSPASCPSWTYPASPFSLALWAAAGIGYQLIRYGDMENKPESYQKGLNIIDFWVRTAMTEHGAPEVCYNPTITGFEPMPFWTRMIADGLENILDAYVYMKKKGEESRIGWLSARKQPIGTCACKTRTAAGTAPITRMTALCGWIQKPIPSAWCAF